MTRRVPLRSRIPLRRGPWRRRPKAKGPHAGVAARGGTFRQVRAAKWARLCARVRRRDGNRCRFCGASALAAPVDHILTRRLCLSDALEALACLCPAHHGVKTADVERALFQGDPYPLRRWLAVIGTTGPIPGDRLVERALHRLRVLLDKEAYHGQPNFRTPRRPEDQGTRQGHKTDREGEGDLGRVNEDASDLAR